MTACDKHASYDTAELTTTFQDFIERTMAQIKNTLKIDKCLQ
jgi:hypothetical protein